MRHYKKYIKKYGFLFSIAIVFLMIEAICDLLLPTILASIIDNGVANNDLEYVLNMGGMMLLVTGIGALGAIIRNIISSNLSQKLGAELRSDLYRKIQSLRLEEMNQFEASSLVTRLTNDVNQVQMFVNGLMRIMVKAPLVCLGSIFMAVRLNASISWVLLLVIPIVALIIVLNVKISLPFFMRVQKATDRLNGVVREFLSGIRVIRAFNRGRFEQSRFDEKNEQLSGTSMKAMRIMSIFSPGISLTVNFGIVLVLLAGGWNINDGQMQVGEVVAYVNYMTQILNALVALQVLIVSFTKAMASAKRVNEVLSLTPTVLDKESFSLQKTGGEDAPAVVFDHVSFTYPGAKEEALTGLTFTVKKGQTVGVIGGTGSGKSSLVNLLPRFYDVTKGAVLIDGVDVRDYPQRELRSKIGMVPQKAVLFSGSIRDNMKWGKEDATDEEINEALLIAQAKEFVDAKEGCLDYMLNQGGKNLSGGQRQRLTIARALVRKPEILILDDSASALDFATDAALRRALNERTKGMTVFMVSQRTATIQNADVILVLEDGEIVGIGTHKELQETCEVYKEICQSQVSAEEVEA